MRAFPDPDRPSGLVDGVKFEPFNSIRGNQLVLQGEKKSEEERGEGEYRHVERRYGSFSRSMPLPAEVDEDRVKAMLKQGVLEVTVPKSTGARGKKVEIEA